MTSGNADISLVNNALNKILLEDNKDLRTSPTSSAHELDSPHTRSRRGSGAGRSQPVSRRNSSGSGFGHPLTAFTKSSDEHRLPHASESKLQRAEKEITEMLWATPEKLKEITEVFCETLQQGLSKDGQIVPMLPAYVFGLPTGEEKGDYIAVDLGGTNLRVCHITLLGSGKFDMTSVKYRFTESQKHEDGKQLFKFCAECVVAFLRDQFGPEKTPGEVEEDVEGLEGVELPKGMSLGFTFSYPCHQERIDHGVLIRWTKGFGAPNVENENVADLFNQALENEGCPLRLTALINDTTGTLIASSYVDTSTKIAVIMGTGCNAAYMETFSNIHKLDGVIPGTQPLEQMAINCEYGAFDSFHHDVLPRTIYDEQIDMASNKPHEQSFEKMIAGAYLGEIFRRIIYDLIERGTLFKGQQTHKLANINSFDTAFLSLMQSDNTEEFLTILGLWSHFFGLETTQAERKFLHSVADAVVVRAARLSSCGIAAIAKKMGYDQTGCGVAVDGSLYSKNPGYPERIHAALIDIFGEKGEKIKTYHAEDGSGVGAAVIAAMTQQRKSKGIHVDF